MQTEIGNCQNTHIDKDHQWKKSLKISQVVTENYQKQESPLKVHVEVGNLLWPALQNFDI